MKKIYSAPKRAAIFIICVMAVIVAISVTAVKSTLISKAQAEEVALRDAGLSETEVSALRAGLEFDDGRFQYEVDFYSNGAEYEYQIQAKDGDIIARDIEGEANRDVYGQEPPQETSRQFAANGEAYVDGNSAVQSQDKSLEEAKAAALMDAGLAESDVTFKKTELEHERGKQVYDIEFYTADAEYDYEINASDGSVVEKSVEAFKRQMNPAGSTESGLGDNYIGIDSAKEIVLNHANLNESDVQFAKTKLEYDDGIAEYEIEFYFDRTEYDYTVDAVSGNIIEYDVDYD